MKIEVIHIDVGNKVFCDLCGKEYTDDEKSCGGFLFNGKAVCPDCADDFFKTIKIYKEEDYITDKAREGETFRDFVYRIREKNITGIRIRGKNITGIDLGDL